jgi:Na+-transporting NADH:ubiquinone oxidoreductase subunit NqrA
MKKDRLEWVMSGLNQYNLTKTEDHFIKTALEDFDKNQALTEHQEEKLETLYKEKSKLTPNKKSSGYFTFAETTPKKPKVRRSRSRDVF